MAPTTDPMDDSAKALWNDLHDLFEPDDGSLPEIRVNFVEFGSVASGFALLRKLAVRDVTVGGSNFWSKVHGEERPVNSVPNAAALVVSGEAEAFHVVLASGRLSPGGS
jgi:hypothetical protein